LLHNTISEAADPVSDRRHTVEPGETWLRLSQWWYGDPALDRLIATANGSSVADSPTPRQLLFYPDLAEF
jgi:nucleoid-associated protein YgaU